MTYQVTDDELRHIPGCTPLKIYIVLNNSPNGMTAAELAELTGSPKRTVFTTLGEMLKSAQLCKNGTIYVQKRHKSAEMALEKERTKEKENISSKNLKEEEGARAREEKEVDFISSLLDNNAQLEALLMTCHLPPQADLQTYFRPFAERFKTDLEASGEDLYLLDRKSAKYRFKCWFTKHYKEIDNGKWKIDNDVRTTISCPLDTPRDVSKDTVNWDELLEIAKRKRAEREAARAK